jgi:hypothetical protein
MGSKLRLGRRAVFFICAVWPRASEDKKKRAMHPAPWRWPRGGYGARYAVGVDSVRALEALVKEADALEADREAHVGDRPVRRRRSAAPAPCGAVVRQIACVRRLAERGPELAADVRARQARGVRQVLDGELLEVASVARSLALRRWRAGGTNVVT